MCVCVFVCVCTPCPPLLLTHCAPTLLLQLHSVTASSPSHRRHWDKSQCHHASRLNAKPPTHPPFLFSVALHHPPRTHTPFHPPQSIPLHLPSFCSCPLPYCYKTNLPSDRIILRAGPRRGGPGRTGLLSWPPPRTQLVVSPRNPGSHSAEGQRRGKRGATLVDSNRWPLCMPEWMPLSLIPTNLVIKYPCCHDWKSAFLCPRLPVGQQETSAQLKLIWTEMAG